VTPDALDLLSRHDWPGNIRELRNALEQATLMTDDAVLDASHFAALASDADGSRSSAAAPAEAVPRATAAAATAASAATDERTGAITPLPQAIAELEARMIQAALAATGGNKLAASRLLGISRATLYEKLASFGIAAPRPLEWRGP